eukprot:200196_1
MYQSLTYLLITTLLIENSIKGQEVITGIWDDDFAYDTFGINGWKMYSWQGYTNLGNVYVTGNGGRKYHGRFTKRYNSENGRWTGMERQFKCSLGSYVKIKYSFAFCRTE